MAANEEEIARMLNPTNANHVISSGAPEGGSNTVLVSSYNAKATYARHPTDPRRIPRYVICCCPDAKGEHCGRGRTLGGCRRRGTRRGGMGGQSYAAVFRETKAQLPRDCP
jgi:hypothetical protein